MKDATHAKGKGKGDRVVQGSKYMEVSVTIGVGSTDIPHSTIHAME